MTADEASPSETDSATSESNRVAKNAVVLVTLRVAAPILSFALLLVLSRILGVEGMGRYSLAYGFLFLFNAIAPLGLYAVITRDGARDRSRLSAMVNTAFSLGTISSIALTLLMSLLAVVMGYDIDTRNAIIIVSVAILPFTLGNFLEGACVALQRMDYFAYSIIAEYLFKVGVGVALLLAGYGLEAVLMAAIGGKVIACLIMSVLVRRYDIYVRWAWDQGMRRHLLRLAPAFMMIAIFATLYWRIDIFMLSKLTSIADVGQYGAGYKLLEFAMIIPQSVCLALYPQMAIFYQSDHDAFRKLSLTAARYLMALCLPLALIVSLGANFIITLMYGNEFEEASRTLVVLIWTVLPYAVVRFQSFVLLSADKQNIDLVFNVCMAMVNVVLNLVLIPEYGHTGAAMATLASILVYTGVQWFYFHKNLNGHYFKVVAPGAMMLSALVLVGVFFLVSMLDVLTALIAASMAYVIGLVMSGFFSRSELATMKVLPVLDRLGVSSRLRA